MVDGASQVNKKYFFFNFSKSTVSIAVGTHAAQRPQGWRSGGAVADRVRP